MNLKRHFYNHHHYQINEIKQCVILEPQFHQQLLAKKLWGKFGFKKIGGSSIGDVLQLNQYKSPFAAFCRIAWIGLPILDRKYVDAGIAIEPKVIQAIEQVSKQKVQTFPGQKYNYDYFAHKDTIVGGLPDGYLPKTNRVLEIKTTSLKNLTKWKEYGLPVSYLKQAELYAYLMGAPHFAIIATFLEPEDYLDPAAFPIEQRIIKSWKFKVNHQGIMDDIAKIKQWYKKYTTSGISPPYDLVLDADQLAYLKCRTEEEWIALQEKWKVEGKIPRD